ncbi:hypothetical protein BMS3Bbin12_00596 [bacterium BMS3Bbin12]|nr:hypothetical protein BMS3Bbin12_00596 [bacterium BMS3Bbin12]GBE51116.1 hypothetical protein BMS3Bbin13_02071 [bacterium BMS3Bbin13]
MVNAMSTDQNIVYFADPDKVPAKDENPTTRRPLQELQDQFVRRVTELFAAMLDNTDDALFALADKAESNSVQSMYFDSMREVRLKRGEMEARFRAEVLDDFRALRRQPVGTASADGKREVADGSCEELSLVGHDDLEESLAIDGMVGKARSRHAQVLAQLRVRLDHLLPGVGLDEGAGPVDPLRLCGAFRRAGQVLDLEVRAKLVVYKLFDKSVMEALGELYTQLNHLLINAGVLPHIKLKAPGARASAGGYRPRDGDPDPPFAGIGEDPCVYAAGEDGEVFGALQTLLADRRGAVPGANPPGAAIGAGMTAAYAPGDVLRALSLLQTGHRLPPPEGEARALGPVELRTALGGALAQLPGGGFGKALGRADEDIIDIVAMLFDFILGDGALPDRAKALLAQLQIPMIKVAFLDKSFFSSRRHPARQLLNELAQAVADTDAPEAVYRCTAEAVDRILQEFENDVGVFAQVLEAYRRDIAPEATPEPEPGPDADPVAAARERARTTIARCLEGRDPPAVVAALLHDAWMEVLTEIALDEQAGPADWDGAVEVVERVLWSVEPKADYEERKRLIGAIPGLLRDLRRGLARISMPSRQLGTCFQALQECHIECIKDTAFPAGGAAHAEPAGAQAEAEVEVEVEAEAEAEDTAPAPSADEPQPEDSAPAQTAASETLPEPVAVPDPPEAGGDWDADPGAGDVEEIVLCGDPGPEAAGTGGTEEDDEHIRRLRAIAVGTRFEFTEPGGASVHAKLSARIERTGKFIFVNRAGFKVAEKSLHGLAMEMRRGTADILDEGLLFDKALEAVISNLRKARA